MMLQRVDNLIMRGSPNLLLPSGKKAQSTKMKNALISKDPAQNVKLQGALCGHVTCDHAQPKQHLLDLLAEGKPKLLGTGKPVCFSLGQAAVEAEQVLSSTSGG